MWLLMCVELFLWCIRVCNQVLVYKRGNSNGGNGGGGGGSGASQASLLVARLDVQCAANIYPRTVSVFILQIFVSI